MLDILADRKDRKGLTGQILVNGERQPLNFKCMSGYVVQVQRIIRQKLWCIMSHGNVSEKNCLVHFPLFLLLTYIIYYMCS